MEFDHEKSLKYSTIKPNIKEIYHIKIKRRLL